ncbi:unnamed protein product [Laminaria digitata]
MAKDSSSKKEGVLYCCTPRYEYHATRSMIPVPDTGQQDTYTYKQRECTSSAGAVIRTGRPKLDFLSEQRCVPY